MNIIEKLHAVHQAKTEPKFLALPLPTRQKLGNMIYSLQWIWNNSFNPEEARGSNEAQKAFFDYYEPEDAALVAKAYKAVFE